MYKRREKAQRYEVDLLWEMGCENTPPSYFLSHIYPINISINYIKS